MQGGIRKVCNARPKTALSQYPQIKHLVETLNSWIPSQQTYLDPWIGSSAWRRGSGQMISSKINGLKIWQPQQLIWNCP